jgi:hypothetical protein
MALWTIAMALATVFKIVADCSKETLLPLYREHQLPTRQAASHEVAADTNDQQAKKGTACGNASGTRAAASRRRRSPSRAPRRHP